jgi:8-oxo-dGTP diphosphatase
MVSQLAAIVLFDDANRLLLQHRTDDAPTFPGHWSFFGGGVEPGETPQEAVVRETLEELAYRLRKPRLWHTQDFIDKGLTYTQFIFIERYDGSDLVLGEGQAMAWFAAAETAPLLMSAHTRRAVEALGRWLAETDRNA